jgi:hypothetical protein
VDARCQRGIGRECMIYGFILCGLLLSSLSSISFLSSLPVSPCLSLSLPLSLSLISHLSRALRSWS